MIVAKSILFVNVKIILQIQTLFLFIKILLFGRDTADTS